MRRTGWLTVLGATATATYVAARAGAARRARRGAPTDPPAADPRPAAETADSPPAAPAEPPAATGRRVEAPTGAVTIVPVAMEATSALEPRLPERNGSPLHAASGNGTAIARPRVRGPLELPPARRPTAGTLAGLALVAALAALALGAAGIALWAQDDDGADTAASAEARRAVALLSKPSTERVPLAGSGRRALLAVGSAARGYLVLRGLPPAPRGRAYEAWVVGSSGVPWPAALFTGAERLVTLSRPVPPGAAVGVSLESAAGSDVPTERFRFVARRPTR